MKIKFLLSCLFLLFAVQLFAIPYGHPCAAKRDRHYKNHPKTTTADLAEMNYDIKRLNFNLLASDTSTFLRGDVITAAVVTADSMATYVFELDSLITLDSAKFNGISVSVVRIGDVRKINLTSALHAGTYFTAEIYYHGIPPAAGGFFTALTHTVSTHGTNMVFSLSDPYAAKNWWPSKQCIDDKIDTVDMFVTVPSGVVDGSNGVLVNVDTTSTPGFWKYHWQTHYPIDYYLISITIARYVEDRSFLHFTGSTDSMLIQNFFMDTATFNPTYKINFDSIGQIINYFSSLFGRYPFWQEKYGVCYTTLGGGMEHQTMTTIGVPNTYIIAHELCHQWFGDHVTYATWGDVWLSEGFATFSEQLFYTHFWGPAAGLAHRKALNNSAMSPACGSVYVTDTSGPSTIFSTTYVYDKAQAVVNMLRYIAPADSLFFTVLKTYQQHFAFGNASTSDLKHIADSVYSMNLDTFFNQWIYGQGYPSYKIWWDQVGSTVYVKLVQIASCPSVTPLFRTPLELQLHGASADTIVKVYNYLDTQVFTFNWAQTMDSVMLNPDVWTLCKLIGTVHKDTTLPLGINFKTQSFKVFPNPTKNFWQVEQLPENTDLTLIDMFGKMVWTGKSDRDKTIIPGKQLPAGEYILHLSSGEENSTMKLTHW